MSSDIVYGALRTWLTTNWTTTPIAWPNEEFSDPEPPSPWIMVQMQGADYEQESFGANTIASNRWVETGSVFIHVFVPVNTGEMLGAQYARQLAESMMGLTLPNSIVIRQMSIGAGERGDENGNWWRISLYANFTRG